MQCGVVMVLYAYPQANDMQSNNATVIATNMYLAIGNTLFLILASPKTLIKIYSIGQIYLQGLSEPLKSIFSAKIMIGLATLHRQLGLLG